MNAQLMLDRISEFQAQRDLLSTQKQTLVDCVLSEEIKAKLAEIDIEFADSFRSVDQNIEELTLQAKEQVGLYGETIRGTHLMAIYVKGRITWDGKKLDGMMALIPELVAARKEGDPTVTIRRI